MTERKALYQSPGEKGKRGFEDLECYRLALEVMARIHAFSKTLPPDEKYDLYAQTRCSAKGVTGNIAGSMEFGDKIIHEDQSAYEFESQEDPDNEK